MFSALCVCLFIIWKGFCSMQTDQISFHLFSNDLYVAGIRIWRHHSGLFGFLYTIGNQIFSFGQSIWNFIQKRLKSHDITFFLIFFYITGLLPLLVDYITSSVVLRKYNFFTVGFKNNGTSYLIIKLIKGVELKPEYKFKYLR